MRKKRALILSTSFIIILVCAAAVWFLTADSTSAADKTIIAVDGSSTVYPITEAVAEEFQKTNKTKVTVGISGTGGGFKKFCNNETVISDASRPIKPKEIELCSAKGIEYIELPIAFDGLAVVVNPANSWVDHLTVAELKKMWAPESQGKVKTWNQIRDGWPTSDIRLFGPGVDSGTYDYFTEAVVGVEHSSRGDFTASEDDNVLVQGVASDKGGLGFFGYAYYAENKNRLKIVPIDDGIDANGKAPVTPSETTVSNGTYQPLSRPIFIYVNKKAAAERPELDAFVKFYLANAMKLSKEVSYIPLPKEAMDLVSKRYTDKKVGSAFGGHGSKVGVTIQELLKSEK